MDVHTYLRTVLLCLYVCILGYEIEIMVSFFMYVDYLSLEISTLFIFKIWTHKEVTVLMGIYGW